MVPCISRRTAARSTTIFGLVSLLVASGGCGRQPIEESSDVSTRDMSIVLEVENEGGKTRVRVELLARLPYTGQVALSGGDRLVLKQSTGVDVEGDLRPDPESDRWNVLESARVEGTFVVVLLRPGDRSMESYATLPKPFTLQGPTGSIRRTDPIALRWDADARPGQVTTLSVVGPCTTGLSRTLVEDTGEYVINGGEIPQPKPGVADGCDVTVTVKREAPTSSTSSSTYARSFQARKLVLRLGS